MKSCNYNTCVALRDLVLSELYKWYQIAQSVSFSAGVGYILMSFFLEYVILDEPVFFLKEN